MKTIPAKRLTWIVVGLLLLTTLSTVLVLAPRRVSGSEPTLLDQPRGEEGSEGEPNEQNSQSRMTVLLAGTDRASGLSDVMMLLSLNRETGEVWVLQLPRDTYVHCGSGSYRKLNGIPAALGGMEQTREFLENALGIEIHRYAKVSPDAFQQAIDAIGGVEIELEQALDYEDPAQGLSIHLPAGKQRLNGREAEQFVRFRADYVRGDLGRMDAQKIFLTALLEQIRSELSPMTLAKLGVALLGKVDTDLDFRDMVILSEEILALKTEKIYFLTAPGADVTTSSGGSFYVLSAPAMNEILTDAFGGTSGRFDPDRRFLYQKSKEFTKIYESYVPYEVIHAEGISENGLGIPRKE